MMLGRLDTGQLDVLQRISAVNLWLTRAHHDLPEPLTVQGLIVHLGLPEKKIAIERNREIVPKSTFEQAKLSEGDILEIIHFIGGG